MNTPPHSIADVRKFWDERPCNIRHSKAQIGSKTYFDEVEHRKYFVEPHIPKFAEFEIWKGKKVLEVGCGIGTDAINFVRSGAIYTGVELSKESLNLTKKRFSTYKLSGTLLEGNAEELDTIFSETNKFDLIYSFGVLHHTPNIQKALTSISKLMNESSRLKIMVYAKNSWKQAMINSGLDQPEAQFGCPIANSYSKAEISKMLNECGFTVSNIQKTHIFPFKVPEYKNYEYKKEPWFEIMPNEVFKTLEHNFGWHLLVDSKLA